MMYFGSHSKGLLGPIICELRNQFGTAVYTFIKKVFHLSQQKLNFPFFVLFNSKTQMNINVTSTILQISQDISLSNITKHIFKWCHSFFSLDFSSKLQKKPH